MSRETWGAFLDGLILMGNLGVALFFFRFWRKTRDFLFGYFSLAFLFLGMERVVIFFLRPPDESAPPVYLIRLVAFLIIIGAIIKKNIANSSTK